MGLSIPHVKDDEDIDFTPNGKVRSDAAFASAGGGVVAALRCAALVW